jgi:hypothetical protein
VDRLVSDVYLPWASTEQVTKQRPERSANAQGASDGNTQSDFLGSSRLLAGSGLPITGAWQAPLIKASLKDAPSAA